MGIFPEIHFHKSGLIKKISVENFYRFRTDKNPNFQKEFRFLLSRNGIFITDLIKIYATVHEMLHCYIYYIRGGGAGCGYVDTNVPRCQKTMINLSRTDVKKIVCGGVCKCLGFLKGLGGGRSSLRL